MREPLTITELSLLVRDVLEGGFPFVAVVGEVTGRVNYSAPGHVYFDLKDSQNFLKCVCWGGDARRLDFTVREGLQVIAYGKLTYYGPQAKLQLAVSRMEAVGVGRGDAAKRELLEKLRGEGHIDRPRKPLPRFPRRVVLVTAQSGAAVQDMIKLFATRWRHCELLVANCRVQGEQAPAEIAAAIRMVNQLTIPIDAVIVGRGGGSAEDLNAYDAEVVARAIIACRLPVIAAIGHEIDTSVADVVADLRAETPSAAVTRLTPDRRELQADLRNYKQRYISALHTRVTRQRRLLELYANRPAFLRPLDRIRRHEQRLDDLAERMRQAIERKLTTNRTKALALAARLESVSPLNILKRGYSVTRTPDGRVVRTARDVATGETIITTLAAGEVRSTVQ